MLLPMRELVLMAKALSDPSRVRILIALREHELCVCELCDSLAMTQSTLSTHLQVIRQAELISARKEGKWMYYRIASGAEGLLGQLFQSFSSALKKDLMLSRDAKNLKDRLRLRNGDSCCIGFSDRSCK
jgi:ArsR family transcriptional regulator